MLRIKKNVFEDLLAHSREDAPVEACGYLAEKDGILVSGYRLSNTDNAVDHYTLDPKEQFAAVRDMRAAGEKLKAVYHSHPESPARPSQEDIRLAYDPSLSYVIVSLEGDEPAVRSFVISGGEVTPEEIAVV